MTCQWCGLHGTDAEHERDVMVKAARVSEGFCTFCPGRLEVLHDCGYHCGFYQRGGSSGYVVSTSPISTASRLLR